MEFPIGTEVYESMSACCSAPVVRCETCGEDAPEHRECARCRELVEVVGEDRLLSRDERLASHGAYVKLPKYETHVVGVVQGRCETCGGVGSHPGVVGRYECRRCGGSGSTSR